MSLSHTGGIVDKSKDPLRERCLSSTTYSIQYSLVRRTSIQVVLVNVDTRKDTYFSTWKVSGPHGPICGGTERKTDEICGTLHHHTSYRVTARISIPAPVPTLVWSDVEVSRLLAIYTLLSSPLSPWSSPLLQIPTPSLPLSPPSPMLSPTPPPSPIHSLGYRDAMIRMRDEVASTSHSLPLPPPFILSPTRPDAPSLGIQPPLSISVPTSSPPLLLPSASRREDRPEVTLPPRKRLGIALGPGYEVGESSSVAAARPARCLRADYGFVATIDREIRHDPEREDGYRITDS
ncbi:hypothetical protein Tco_0861353 [Tanacetum coccineum]|uniref:Uncharacterized protein n=1 Tax=Tanacetum coccineum TaxID=301880 RepID=A0ABQ5BKX3_9ASTR